MQRILEPEVMDTWEEAIEYDAMDFTEVNTAFAERVLTVAEANHVTDLQSVKVLDAGTGTARIPILICQKCHNWEVLGIDLAESMLKVGLENIKKSGLQSRIELSLIDVKNMPYSDGEFDIVISNSLVHHLPDPLPFFQEVKRVLKPTGTILLRDLVRPKTEETMNAWVDSVGIEYDDRQKQLFRDSLHAAFTLEEVKALLQKAGLEGLSVYQSSERHWTAETSVLKG